MIIWLASYPRSGNTFFRMVLNHRYNLPTLSIYEDSRVGLDGIAGIVGHVDVSGRLDQIADADQPYLVKTHEPPHDYNPAVYIVRDGRDVITSYTKYKLSFNRSRWSAWRRMLPPYSTINIMKNLVLSYDDYGGWSRHVEQWRNRPGKVILLRYEDLKENPLEESDRVIRMLGLDLKPTRLDPLPTFKQLHAASPRFFRKGLSGSWREDMPPSIQQLFWRYHGHVMSELGYSRS